MNPEMYKAIVDLMDIFDNSTINGEKVRCFKMMKDIADGEMSTGNMSENEKILVQKQLNDSLEWLQSIGVTIKYKEELAALIK